MSRDALPGLPRRAAASRSCWPSRSAGMNIAEFCGTAGHGGAGVSQSSSRSSEKDGSHRRADSAARSRRACASCRAWACSYLTLSRAAATLSGGESAAHPPGHADRLVADGRALYPRRAVHRPAPARQRQAARHAAASLRDLGNTLIVVEHDEDTMRAADYIVDIGPGAGVHGGEVVGCRHAGGDHARDRAPSPGSISPASGRSPCPAQRRTGNAASCTVMRRAREQPARTSTCSIPLGVHDVRDRRVRQRQVARSSTRYSIKTLAARAQPRASVRARQTRRHRRAWSTWTRSSTSTRRPIGRTPRSNPGDLYRPVRPTSATLFAATQDAKRARLQRRAASRFNVKGGRCEACTRRRHC